MVYFQRMSEAWFSCGADLFHSTGVIFFAFLRRANGKRQSELGAPDMHARRGKVSRAPRSLRNSFARKAKKTTPVLLAIWSPVLHGILYRHIRTYLKCQQNHSNKLMTGARSPSCRLGSVQLNL